MWLLVSSFTTLANSLRYAAPPCCGLTPLMPSPASESAWHQTVIAPQQPEGGGTSKVWGGQLTAIFVHGQTDCVEVLP